MRYSILFLGIIAVTSGTPIKTPDSSCDSVLQCFLAPLADESAAARFCAAKFPNDATVAATSTANIKSNNPLFVSLSRAAKDVASTFCRCNFGGGRGGRGGGGSCSRGGFSGRGRIRRYPAE